MGQNPSAVSSLETEIQHAQGKLAANFDLIKSIATVSHEHVICCIEELNAR